MSEMGSSARATKLMTCLQSLNHASSQVSGSQLHSHVYQACSASVFASNIWSLVCSCSRNGTISEVQEAEGIGSQLLSRACSNSKVSSFMRDHDHRYGRPAELSVVKAGKQEKPGHQGANHASTKKGKASHQVMYHMSLCIYACM